MIAILLGLLGAALAGTLVAQAPQKVAIILRGRQHVAAAGDNDDPNWVNNNIDANVAEMKSALSKQGYTVYVVDHFETGGTAENPSFTQIVDKLVQGPGALHPGDQVITYYTGHGNRADKKGTEGDPKNFKGSPTSDPTDYTNMFQGYMDMAGGPNGMSITATQFKIQIKRLADTTQHVNVVIDDCYPQTFSQALSGVNGVDSMTFSSRYDEPSDAGAKDTYVLLNLKPDEGNAKLKDLKAVVTTYQASLDQLNLSLPPGTVTITDHNGKGEPGAYLHFQRPAEQGKMGDTSGFSYGIIKYIDSLPPNGNLSAQQVLQGAFEGGWKYNPNALAGLLDWKTTETAYSTGTGRSLSDQQKKQRYGKTHPVIFLSGTSGWIYVFPTPLISQGADPNPYLGVPGAPPIATPGEPPATPKATETPTPGTPESGTSTPKAEGGETPQPETPTPEPKKTPDENQSGGTTPGGTSGGTQATPGTSQTSSEAQVQIARQATNDFGAGSYQELATLQPGVARSWKDFDPKGNLREEGLDQYSTTPSGTTVKTEETRNYFNDHGTLDARTISDWDLTGKQLSFRLTDYSFRGYKISDHITKYETEGHVESTWNPRTYDWSSITIPYKPAATPATPPNQTGSGAGTQWNWNLRVDYNIGCLFPLDYHAGDQFSGSCWKAPYAEAFKPVPGLYEYSFPIKSYDLQDGTPNWTGLEIGVKGYGYAPVGSDGSFSVHIPMDWKGALQFQVRQPDFLTGNVPFTTNFQIGDPMVSPALPSNLFSKQSRNNIDYEAADHLVDLWNEAFDLKEEYNYYKQHGENYPGEMEDVLDNLDDVYDEIDYATDYLPTSVIVSMARGMAQENRDINETLRTQSLTQEQETNLQEYDRWAKFLEKEADYFTEEATYYSHYAITPFWTSPVQTQDKLVALRGPFFGDPYDTGIYIDGTPIHPIVMTPQFSYFMPTPGLTAGKHTYTIDSPGMPETTLPFFYMWMTMWADQLNLHKGQKTTYHLKLDLNFNGANSLWNSSWSSSFFPSDLVSPTDLQNSPMPGPSRKGTITLSITDATPGVITMKNVFETFDASRFEPQGSIQVDGGVGAIQDGSFSIIGVAHAYLQPVVGLGAWPGSGTPSASMPASNNLFNNYGWNLGPTTTGAPTNLNCPGEGAGATTPGATEPSTSPSQDYNLPLSHCMGSATLDLYTRAMGGPSTVEIGNPPTQDEIDAARTRLRNAQDRAKKALENYGLAWNKNFTTWMDVYNRVPGDIYKAYTDALHNWVTTHDAFEKALDDLVKNSSTENGAKLEAASVDRAKADDAYDKAKQDLIDHLKPEDKKAYLDAKAAKDAAEIEKILADEELRDARAALDDLHLPPSTWLKYAF